jgi:hypothetical protein
MFLNFFIFLLINKGKAASIYIRDALQGYGFISCLKLGPITFR